MRKGFSLVAPDPLYIPLHPPPLPRIASYTIESLLSSLRNIQLGAVEEVHWRRDSGDRRPVSECSPLPVKAQRRPDLSRRLLLGRLFSKSGKCFNWCVVASSRALNLTRAHVSPLSSRRKRSQRQAKIQSKPRGKGKEVSSLACQIGGLAAFPSAFNTL
jgi:hypothetical protein